jgi:GTP-binding protein
MASVIAIVGRPNVGKSTLFNRLSRSRDALVDDRPGITRDRLYAAVEYDGTPLTLIDTGGFDDTGEDHFSEKVRQQVEKAIEEADRIIFMVDGLHGLMPADQEIAALLRRSQKEIFVAVNKIDGPEHDPLSLDFYRLGVDRVYPLSAAHGYGFRALMEDLIQGLPGQGVEKEEGDRIRVTVLGRPNVGKSSLINRILGLERLVVSDLPGTTRDAVDTPFRYGGRNYLLIDTAGIRRKGRVTEKIEKFSVVKALRSLDRCHIAVILLDALEGISEQDARICGYAFERRKGLVLAVNKWDLVKKAPEKKRALENAIDRQLHFISFAPRLDLSALTGERVMSLFQKIDLVYDQFSRRIPTAEVNQTIQEMVSEHPPPIIGRGRIRFFYATQADIRPPTFVVFVNRPEKIHFSYERFLSNQLRRRLRLESTPVRIKFKKRQ